MKLLIKGIIDEDFVNYKVPSMTINTNICSFKCDAECGKNVCQNSSLVKSPSVEISYNDIANRYLHNPITKAICIAGLEPFDQWAELVGLIRTIRDEFKCNDDIVIYTGYTEDEIEHYTDILKSSWKNIVIKFGRFIPDQSKHYDEVLGVHLASPNQYAKRIS